MLPETMTVIEAKAHGGPEVLAPGTARRSSAAGEVLIAVKAAGVNRPDVLQRLGLYPPPNGASDLLGLEVAGHVVACGPGARHDTEKAMPFARSPMAAATPSIALRRKARHCRCPAASTWSRQRLCPRPCSPCGTMCSSAAACSLANGCSCMAARAASAPPRYKWARLFGANVLVTAGSAEKVRACEELGADRAINYRSEDFVEAVKEATQRHGADVILDMVGGDYIERDLRAAALDGRIVQIAFLKTSKVEIDLIASDDAAPDADRLDLARPSAEAKARIARASRRRSGR